jgi:hypothetical protein
LIPLESDHKELRCSRRLRKLFITAINFDASLTSRKEFHCTMLPLFPGWLPSHKLCKFRLNKTFHPNQFIINLKLNFYLNASVKVRMNLFADQILFKEAFKFAIMFELLVPISEGKIIRKV